MKSPMRSTKIVAGRPMSQAGNVEQVDATDAATQVVFKFPSPVTAAN